MEEIEATEARQGQLGKEPKDQEEEEEGEEEEWVRRSHVGQDLRGAGGKEEEEEEEEDAEEGHRDADDTFTTCPVLRPCMEEFSDFRRYMEQLDTKYWRHGIVKIVPPEQWFPERRKTGKYAEEKLEQFAFKPLVQHCVGSKGKYELLFGGGKRVTVKEFRERLRKLGREACKKTDPHAVAVQFWRRIQTLGSTQAQSPANNSPLYGADVVGTLFREKQPGEAGEAPLPLEEAQAGDAGTWDMNGLDNVLRLLPANLSGINTPMLYFGGWLAMFAFHTEDMDLNSINYLHCGSPKTWYAVPPSHAGHLERLAAQCFSERAKDCDQFLRHKTIMLSPNMLKNSKIPFHTVLQRSGEFVVTFPRSYHSGFNHGFNVAEATNFAMPRWIPYGLKAKPCECEQDNASIGMAWFITRFFRDLIRKRRRNNTPRPEPRPDLTEASFRARWRQSRDRSTTSSSDSSNNQADVHPTRGRKSRRIRYALRDPAGDYISSPSSLSRGDGDDEDDDEDTRPLHFRRARPAPKPSVDEAFEEEVNHALYIDRGGDAVSWRFHCSCGERCTGEHPQRKHPSGAMFQCNACKFWTHIACTFPEIGSTVNVPEKYHTPKHHLLCWVCRDLSDNESDTIDEAYDEVVPTGGTNSHGVGLNTPAAVGSRTDQDLQPTTRHRPPRPVTESDISDGDEMPDVFAATGREGLLPPLPAPRPPLRACVGSKVISKSSSAAAATSESSSGAAALSSTAAAATAAGTATATAAAAAAAATAASSSAATASTSGATLSSSSAAEARRTSAAPSASLPVSSTALGALAGPAEMPRPPQVLPPAANPSHNSVTGQPRTSPHHDGLSVRNVPSRVPDTEATSAALGTSVDPGSAPKPVLLRVGALPLQPQTQSQDNSSNHTASATAAADDSSRVGEKRKLSGSAPSREDATNVVEG